MAKDVINMAQVDRCFPAAEAAPITVREALPNSDGACPVQIGQDVKDRWANTVPGKPLWGFGGGQVRLNLQKHAPSLTKCGTSGYSMFHPSEPRPLSINEMGRIASLPDAFMFRCSYSDAKDVIGNSVPPMMMRAIAGQIAEVMFGKTTWRPDRRMDYPAILEAAWAQHLTPRGPDAPTVISTFAGCGGSSLGYSMAGYRELLAVEWDDNAVETFKLNFPGVPVYHGDIAKLSVEECMALAGLSGPGELDVLDGSPPCQGFSTAGKRQMDDDRNQLFREYVRLLRGLQPKVFVMENVSGLVKGKMKLIFAEIMRELKASGYRVSCRLMNAMYFHVPQSRQRLIFVGVRDDLGIEPGHPEAEAKPVTVREAILQDGFVQYRSMFTKGGANTVRRAFVLPSNSLKSQDSLQSTAIVTSENKTDIARDLPAPRLSDRYIKYWLDAKQGERVGRFNSNKKLSANEQAFTALKSEGYGGMYHPTKPRGLSGGERKRIGSFPDAFRFLSWESAVERIGNSVPPLFMRAIARHIREAILDAAHTRSA